MGGSGTGNVRLTSVERVLELARDRGFLGPGPVLAHREHALRFMVVDPPAVALDLGSGGGVPGLVLAEAWPDTRFVLLDADRRRAAFLERAVLDLDWAGRVRVVHGRAEEVGRDVELRGRLDYVSARSFGRPAVTAECGAAFLKVGGVLVVSDPPDGDAERWPAEGVGLLGLTAERREGVTVLSLTEPYPDRFPRRPGVPERRPLF